MSQSPARSYSRSRSRSRSPGQDRGGHYSGHRPQLDNSEDGSSVFVGGLANDTDERVLQNYFEKYGPVVSVKVVTDRETGRSKGYGFVKFEDPRDAADAVNDADQKLLDGRTIRCNVARYRPQREFHPGGRGRGRFDGPRGGYGGGRFGNQGGRGGGRDYYPGGRGGGRDYHSDRDGGMPYSPRDGRPPAFVPKPAPPRVPHPDERRASADEPRRASPSPAPKRRRSHSVGRSGSPPASDAKPAKREKKYSTTPSGSSTSGTSHTSAEGGTSSRRKRKAIGKALPPPGALKKELIQARRREGELNTRIAALEAQLKQASAAQASAAEQVEEQLDEANVKIERLEASQHEYRKRFSSLLRSSQALITARDLLLQYKDDVKTHELDLAGAILDADGFLTREKQARRSRKDSEKKGRLSNGEPGSQEMLEGGGYEETNGVAAAVGAAEQVDAAAMDITPDAPAAVDAASKFKPGIKFTLG